MGVITSQYVNFKSAEYVYSKIKREFKSFGAVNMLDDSDFPLYTAEVLKKLGVSVYKEEEGILHVRNGKTKLPTDFMYLYAAYKCHHNSFETTRKNFQNCQIFENDITCDIIKRTDNCLIECESTDKILERITIKQYVNDNIEEHCYRNPTLLKLSPNVKPHCSEDCLNLLGHNHHHGHHHHNDEITINNGCILTNFNDGEIYLKYYAFPMDEDGCPMIPDIIEVEKAVEWYIKLQVLLNYWMVDDLANAQNKWGKAEQEYEKWAAEARYISKLPSFNKMIDTMRNNRGINKTAFFAQQDKRYW